jgi:hypothetical protein
VVPHVPVCTYAHVREGDMLLAERVKKKTGTKWDRDLPGARCQPDPYEGVNRSVPGGPEITHQRRPKAAYRPSC